MDQKNGKAEDWEQNHINAITLKMIFAAAIATGAATAIAFVLHQNGMGEIKPELLFLPWGIALVFGISTAFRKGVVAGREHMNDGKACCMEEKGAKKGG